MLTLIQDGHLQHAVVRQVHIGAVLLIAEVAQVALVLEVAAIVPIAVPLRARAGHSHIIAPALLVQLHAIQTRLRAALQAPLAVLLHTKTIATIPMGAGGQEQCLRDIIPATFPQILPVE